MDGQVFVLDIGGEGRHAEAWNLNPRRLKTCGPERGRPIPRLIWGRADAIPLPDQWVDRIIVERTPLSRQALQEIRRVARPGATIVLRHARAFGRDPHRFAKEVFGPLRQSSDCLIRARTFQETAFSIPS